jgi:hypothetical protein
LLSFIVGLLTLLGVGMASIVPSASAQPAPTATPTVPTSQRGESVQTAPVPVDKHPKLDSQLVEAARVHRGQGLAPAAQQAITRALDVQGDRVRVVIETDTGGATLPEQLVEARSANLVQALVPAAQLESLAAQPGVRRIRPPFRPVPAAVAGEEVGASGANIWQAAGLTGAGTKVAIIDLGFQDYTQRQTNGDLPPTGPGSLVTQNFGCTPGIENGEVHGAAVAEIVHEMAPGAELHLVCVQTEVDLGLAEAYARLQGIHIINHSVAWFNTSRGDGSGAPGTPDAIVADARANGILWVTAGGNQAQQHWSGTFNDPNGNGFHNFTASDELNNVSIPGLSSVCFELKWDDWPVTSRDYDMFLTNTSGTILFGSTNLQNGTQPPTEELCATNGGLGTFNGAITIQRVSGTGTPRLDLFVLQATPQYVVTAGSIPEPATSPNAMAVGAVCWQDSAIESYSSRGPNLAGVIKPDIAGQDGPSSDTYGQFFFACGFSGFLGVPRNLGGRAGRGGCGRAGQAGQSFIRTQSAAELPGGQGDRPGRGRKRQQLWRGCAEHGSRTVHADADTGQHADRDLHRDERTVADRDQHPVAHADPNGDADGNPRRDRDPDVQPGCDQPRRGEQRGTHRRGVVELWG